jgi:hypothetical protein
MKLTLSLIFLLLIGTGYSQNQKLDSRIDQPNYSIKYPSNWKIDNTGKNGASFYLFAQKDGQINNFGENINLLIQDLHSMNLDLKKYTHISEDQIKIHGTLIESKRITKNSIQGQAIIYEAISAKGLRLKFRQYYFLKNEKAYILTYTAKKETYDWYIQLAEKIMATFKIK